MSEQPDLKHPAESSPRPRYQRWLWKVSLLLTLVAGTVAFAWFYDEPLPDDADLLVELPIYPENDPDNGLSLLAKAGKLTDLDQYKNPDFTDEILETIFETPYRMDLVKAKALMALNEPAWTAYQQAWTKSKFYNPKPLNIDKDLSWLPGLVSYTRLGCLQANILLREGKSDEALAILNQLVHNLSRSREPKGREMLMVFLSNLAMMGYVQQALLESSRYLETKEQCLYAIKILRELEETMDVNRFKMALRMEYTYSRQLAENNGAKLIEELQEMKKHDWIKEAPSRFSFKPNKLLREYAEMIREQLSQYSEGTYVPYSPPPPKPSPIPLFIRKWSIWKWLGLDEKKDGNPLIEIITMDSRISWRIFLDKKAFIRLTQVTLALRAYWLENNRLLPEKLEVLIPQYLLDIPSDPFGKNKMPIRYDAVRRLLWSIGSDGRDEGGKILEAGYYDDKEPTLKLPWD